MSLIMNWFGIPYRFGGREETGIDCSAWVQQIFYESCKILLPRTAREQVSIGRKVKREKLEFGDQRKIEEVFATNNNPTVLVSEF